MTQAIRSKGNAIRNYPGTKTGQQVSCEQSFSIFVISGHLIVVVSEFRLSETQISPQEYTNDTAMDKILTFTDRQAFRNWLGQYGTESGGVWLLFDKKGKFVTASVIGNSNYRRGLHSYS